MVGYGAVKTSNAKLATALPAGLVAVFVGGTSGIGEYTLKAFAKHAKEPRVYFIGRSQEAGARIEQECRSLNPKGTFTFMRADVSLIKTVDEVCGNIKAKERSVNLLFLSTGTLDFYSNTSEGLRLAVALLHYCRARFIRNLLPELRAATSLKRVVSVFAATKEGPMWPDNINADKVPLTKQRGHAASMVTLGMESLAELAPDVSFVHDFPGPVKSGIARDMPGVVGFVVRVIGTVTAPFISIPIDESGAYHLFFATSARFPPAKDGAEGTAGIPIGEGVSFARGNDGETASGMYCVDEHGESADSDVEAQLAKFRTDGSREKIWGNLEREWRRITGA